MISKNKHERSSEIYSKVIITVGLSLTFSLYSRSNSKHTCEESRKNLFFPNIKLVKLNLYFRCEMVLLDLHFKLQ